MLILMNSNYLQLCHYVFLTLFFYKINVKIAMLK